MSVQLLYTVVMVVHCRFLGQQSDSCYCTVNCRVLSTQLFSWTQHYVHVMSTASHDSVSNSAFILSFTNFIIIILCISLSLGCIAINSRLAFQTMDTLGIDLLSFAFVYHSSILRVQFLEFHSNI